VGCVADALVREEVDSRRLNLYDNVLLLHLAFTEAGRLLLPRAPCSWSVPSRELAPLLRR